MKELVSDRRDIVVIGGSAGAVEALKIIVAELPRELPAALFVVVHVPATALSALPHILGRAGPLPVQHATDGEAILPGRILVAPPDRHLLLSERHVHLTAGPREHGHRPSADALFRSAARNHGERVVGVVLTGMLGDGAAGLARIVARGGLGVVQDPSDAAFSSMPEHAVQIAGPQHVLPLSGIACLIREAVGERPGAALAAAPGNPGNPDTGNPFLTPERGGGRNGDAEAASGLKVLGDDRPGRPSGYSCPDCGGVLWERDQEPPLELVCRVGHLYTVESLLEAKNSALEGALWAGVRALEERVSLTNRLAEAQPEGSPARARLTEDAQERQQQAQLLKGLVIRPRSSG